MQTADRSPAFATPTVAAGVVSTFAWLMLAWLSRNSATPLLGTLGVLGITWAALAAALWSSAAPRPAVVLCFAAIYRVIAFGSVPVMEDDHWRFLWDGYRFAATGNPYAEPPLARFGDPAIPPPFRAVLDRVNHPDVPTIYGPATQLAFLLGHTVAPAQLWPWKLVLLGAEAAIVALLWPMLTARGRLFLAWCPLAVFETGFNVHPDGLALALVTAAWRLGTRGRATAAGALLGAAVAAKVFAVLLAPFVLWRLGWRAWVAAAGGGLACYGPFWFQGSAADLAGLRAMAGEWEFNSSAHALVAALTSPEVARVACAAVFGAVWIALFLRWRKGPVASPPGAGIFGAFLLLSATANPWYALWLWPFVALRPTATGAVLLAAVSLAYVTGLNLGDAELGNFEHPTWLRPLEFGAIAAVAAWERWTAVKRNDPGARSRAPGIG